MRVISGLAKGHKLIALKGMETRPTTDRVKEAMFSIVQAYLSESVVLDLFSGSGALGIEALSRGALYADFVEESRMACDIIRTNLIKTKFENFKLHNIPAEKFLKITDKKYDMVFLDPPYHKKLCDMAMEEICQRKLLSDGGIIVCETAADEEIITPYEVIKQSQYGNTKIIICR